MQSNFAERRLMKDLKKMQAENIDQSISAIPTESNIMIWDALIFGPEDTEWDGGIFKLKLKFSE